MVTFTANNLIPVLAKNDGIDTQPPGCFVEIVLKSWHIKAFVYDEQILSHSKADGLNPINFITYIYLNKQDCPWIYDNPV